MFSARALIAINSGHIPLIDLQGTAVVFDARVSAFALLASPIQRPILFGIAARPLCLPRLDAGTLVNEGCVARGRHSAFKRRRARLSWSAR